MIFAVNKPMGISSFDVIRVLQNQYPEGTKIGHGGTLDPRAEGVLVIAVGKESTRQLQDVLKNTTKEYIAEIELGKISHTDDSEGPISEGPSQRQPDMLEISKALALFTGEIDQTPPIFSAIRINGQRAYKRARRGEELSLGSKKVHIHGINLLDYVYPIIKIKVECGSGVYIRSLARDIGVHLGTGAYVKSLIRTKVGAYSIEQSISLQDLKVKAPEAL
jgi:tRNA pseudouridine55 synthase